MQLSLFGINTPDCLARNLHYLFLRNLKIIDMIFNSDDQKNQYFKWNKKN